MLPFRKKDFTKTRTGEDEEPDRRNRKKVQCDPPLIRFRRVLRGRLRVVYLVWQSDGFAFHKHRAQPHHFIAGEKPLAALLAIAADLARRVTMPLGQIPVPFRP